MTQSRIVCIDDFAIKKGQTYGTLIVDYETSRVVDMIPSRDTDSVVQWLKSYPEIEVVSRDGSIGYAKAIRELCPRRCR
jgi:transposase